MTAKDHTSLVYDISDEDNHFPLFLVSPSSKPKNIPYRLQQRKRQFLHGKCELEITQSPRKRTTFEGVVQDIAHFTLSEVKDQEIPLSPQESHIHLACLPVIDSFVSPIPTRTDMLTSPQPLSFEHRPYLKRHKVEHCRSSFSKLYPPGLFIPEL